MNTQYKRLLFVINRDKHKAGELAERLAKLALNAGFETKSVDDYPVAEGEFADADLCCVIGGDGTILGCVAGAAKHGVPIFGVNLGKLGFMSTFTDTISDDEFLSVIGGRHEIEKRTLLSANFGRGEVLALNDFVIRGSNVAGVVTLKVSADGEFVSDFSGDGIIFSTPTGSTAYNLSANGPLIHPQAQAFVLTSICPHTLSNRSIVFAASSRVEVSGAGAVLIADGMVVENWDSEKPLGICTPPQTISFIRPPKRSHFSVLRTKLGWAATPHASGKQDRV